MTVVGLRLKNDLQGISTLNLEEVKLKKNIATTRSFEENYTKFKDVAERVSTFAVLCAEKLRNQNTCCKSMVVFITTNRFRNDLPQYSRSIEIQLPYATNSSIELSKFAMQASKKIFKEGYHYKKAGVIVQDLTPQNTVQQSLFEDRDTRHIPLMQAIDKLNNKFGQQKIKLASQDTKRIWKMKQQKLSPSYTTKLEDIITIHL